MGLILLFQELSQRRISLRRWGNDIECTGGLDEITPELKAGLIEHRAELSKLLTDQMVQQRKVLADLSDWLNRAMPKGYRIDEHPEFWHQYDAELEAVVESRSFSGLEATIQQLKNRIANHFAPYHPLPKPGETVVVFPGHPLEDFEWEENEACVKYKEETG